jgi:hypothetical protein
MGTAITLVLYKSVLASKILLQVVCKTKDVLISLAKYCMRKVCFLILFHVLLVLSWDVTGVCYIRI